MAESRGNGFPDVLTPLTVGPKNKELGFNVGALPSNAPKDPLGVIPGGNGDRSRKDKQGIGSKIDRASKGKKNA